MLRTTNWVGDVVMTLPTLEAIKANFPKSSITVVAKPWVVPIFENHPAVDNIIIFKKEEGFRNMIKEVFRVIKLIRKERFDLAILFQNAIEAALLAWLGGCKYRLGYNTDGRGIFLTHRVTRTSGIMKAHQVEYYLSILRAAGWEAKSHDPVLYPTPKHLKKAEDILSINDIKSDSFILGLGPGAMFGDAKRWPPERFARIGDLAAAKWNAKILIMGSNKETGICGIVEQNMTAQAINLAGKTSLAEAVGVIKQCHLFVTNDSGLMHIAASLGIPTVAIFGSTDSVATGPRGPITRIVKHEIKCAPCLKQTCPADHICMLSVKPEEVWDVMTELRNRE